MYELLEQDDLHEMEKDVQMRLREEILMNNSINQNR